jgi:hypothetical protein
LKSNRWFNQNPFFSQLRIAAAVTLIAAAVVSAIASLNPDPPNTRLTNDNGANGGYVSVYTLATGNPYTDATLNECSISRGRQNEPAIAVDPRNTSVLLGSSNDYCGVYNRGVAAGAELLRSANNLFQLTNLLSLLVNEQLRVTDDVDEQDVPNLELEIRLRMSGHIPLRADYTPYTFD